ncbi:MAG: tetraacyldisaccharide 4'-kinase, partial [Wenzhouxiangellaceae bacterium]
HALAAATEAGAEVVLSDDGLQHQALPRSFEICLVDAARGFGNGRLLPAGPLRQPVSRLESVDLVLRKCSGRERAPELPDGIDFQLESGPLQALTPDADPPPAPPVAIDALAGIADPLPFFDTLVRRGFELRTHRLADHQPISETLLESLSGPVVMTAKDAARLDAGTIAGRRDLFVLPVRAALPEPVVDRVLAHVREFHP